MPTLLSKLKKWTRSRFPGLFMRLHHLKQVLESRPPADPRFQTYTVAIHQPLEPRRKRVLHVIANFWTGGSAQLVVDLIERLGHTYEQEVLTRDLPPKPAYSGFPLHLITEMQDEAPYLDFLQEIQPQLVHLHYLGHERDEWGRADKEWYTTVLRAIEKRGVPVIENINIPTMPLVHPNVHKYVYVSRYVLNQFHPPQLPAQVIYPGSNFSHFDRIPKEAIVDDCIGMVYRLERDKLNESAINVFIETVRLRPQTRVLIVGGGNLLPIFQQAVAKAGMTKAFHFTGYVAYKDLPAYYRKMSVFVAPVHRESFGQVTPFAMHMGLPVAGYRVGALPEILDGEEWLAEPGQAGELAQKIVALLDDRDGRIELGDHLHARAREQFSVEGMITGYKQAYEGLV